MTEILGFINTEDSNLEQCDNFTNVSNIEKEEFKDVKPNHLYPDQENFTIPDHAVILSTMGRLGNQLFQYSAAYALAKEKNFPLYLFDSNCASCYLAKDPSQDTAYYLTNFNLSKDTIIIPYKDENIPLIKKYYTHSTPTYSLYLKKFIPDEFNNSYTKYIFTNNDYVEAKEDRFKTIIIHSFLENYHFFDKYHKELLEQFVISNFDTSNINDILEKTTQENAVCIHVRGTDYITIPAHIPIDYQIAAINFIHSNNLIENPNYFVITDDIPYAQKGLKAYNNMQYITDKTSLEDFYILSHCKHNIMAKSSFSWWASYLNQESKFTIVPCNYYDLYKSNHTTFKIPFKINGTNACANLHSDQYLVQYKDQDGKNIQLFKEL